MNLQVLWGKLKVEYPECFPPSPDPIGTRCFWAGKFGADGSLQCDCTDVDCNLEMLCEIIASYILMPSVVWEEYWNALEGSPLQGEQSRVEILSSLFLVEPQAVVFRNLVGTLL